MAQPTSTLNIHEVADRTATSPRTIRYYIQAGLIPSPGRGAAARYAATVVERVRLIRRWQSERVTLADIAKRLEGMDEDAIREALTDHGTAKGQPTRLPAADGLTHWDRIPIADGIELHVRRPASVPGNRMLEKLVDYVDWLRYHLK